jgi:hypothetical protein
VIVKGMTFAVVLAVFSLGPTNAAFGLNQPTHKIVNEEAAGKSTVDSVLKGLGFAEGLAQFFRGRAATSWIGEGGIREDDGIRFFRHFHDPLKPWETAGLQFFGQFQSSIHWMQRPTDCPDSTWRDGKDWAWSNARCYLRRALTEATVDDRDLAWAYTFRAVGQLMHLVVDASVPEHTRNDPHPLGGLFGSYEYWVERLHRDAEGERAFVAKYLARPERPDPGLVYQSTNDSAAPVPIARLIDEDIYTGEDASITLTPLIGIAEFANANFFSEDSGYRRFLAPNYPHPSVERLVPSTFSPPTGGGIRAYYKKGLGDGLLVDPVLAECAMDAAFQDNGFPTPQYKCADQNVWEQTATSMLPRAVGYAAALLNYFFRGRLEASVTLAADSTGVGATLRLANRTPGEVMDGIFTVYAEDRDGNRRQIPGAVWALSLAPDEASGALTFTVPRDTALASWQVVFRGQLGNEGGVAGQEPVTVAARLGSPTYDILLFSWVSDAAQGHFGEDDQELFFLRPEDYTAPAYYSWSASVSKKRSVGLDVQGYSFTDAGEDHTLFHRDLTNAPGDSAQLLVHGGSCDSTVFTFYERPYLLEGTSGPVTFSVVEFEEPRDLAELLGYRGSVLPGVRRTLGSFTVDGSNTVSLPINLDGARFIGLETSSPPVPAGLGPPPYWIVEVRCSVNAAILVPR